jgi:hypothetical protein
MAHWKKWLALIGLAAVGLGVILVVLRPVPGPGVTWRNYSAIMYGTTEQEVEALLGGPPVDKIPYCDGVKDGSPAVAVARWPGENLTVEVYFSADGRVVQAIGHRVTSFSLDELFTRLFHHQ